MTLSFIVGPLILLIVFLIFITDKWEVVLHGPKNIDHETIYNKYSHLQQQKIRCKVVRDSNNYLKLLVMAADVRKIKA